VRRSALARFIGEAQTPLQQLQSRRSVAAALTQSRA
jgi:hypothetical protein